MASKATRKTKDNGALAEALYGFMRARKAPATGRELHKAMVARGDVTYAEVSRVDEALAFDPRFQRWGRSNYFLLSEWRSFEKGYLPYDETLYEFLRRRARELLKKADRPVHYKHLADRINRDENLDIPAETLKEAMEAPDFKNRDGMYWLGRKDKFKVLNISDAARKVVGNSSRLLTLEDILNAVRKELPEREVKKRTVSAVLAGKEFKHLYGTYWGLSEWDEERVCEMFDTTLRRGRDHIVTESEKRNGKLTVTADLRPMFPAADQTIFIRTRSDSTIHGCDFKAGPKWYVSGMGDYYRKKGIETGDRLTISVRDRKKSLYVVRRARARRRPDLPLARSRVPDWWCTCWHGGFDSGADFNTVTMILETGKKKAGQALVLVAPFFLSDAVSLTLSGEERVIVMAQGSADHLIARAVAERPSAERFKEEAAAVVEFVWPEVSEGYRLDRTCPECGAPLVVRMVSFGLLDASVECSNEDSECKWEERRYKLSTEELDRIIRGTGKPIRNWYPAEIGGGKVLEDFFSRAYIRSFALIRARISDVSDSPVRRCLMWAFLEALELRGSRFTSLYSKHEGNPIMLFERAADQVEERLSQLESDDFWFFDPGTLEQVLEGTKATYAWVPYTEGIPDGALDVVMTQLPFNGLKPLSDEERILDLWAGGRTRAEYPQQVGDLKGYFEEMHRVLKPCGRLGIVIEGQVGAFETFKSLNQVLQDMGFEFAGEVPEAGSEGFAWRERSFMRQPEALLYMKIKKGGGE